MALEKTSSKSDIIDGFQDVERASLANDMAGDERNNNKKANGEIVLVLPLVSQEPRNGGDYQNGTTTHVENCCAICFENYKLGDSVTWSTNREECKHAFHLNCIVEYMARLMEREGNEGGKHLPCPICRRQFLDLPR